MPSHDRWYLEALGIGADGDWDNCLKAFDKASSGSAKSETAASLHWRSSGSQSAMLIADQILTIASGPTSGETSDSSKQHVMAYFRALDFQSAESAAAAANHLISKKTLSDISNDMAPVVIAEALQRLGDGAITENSDAADALERALTDLQGTPQFIQLV